MSDWLPIALLSLIACLFLVLQAVGMPGVSSCTSLSGWTGRETRALSGIGLFLLASGANFGFEGAPRSVQMLLATHSGLSVTWLDTGLQFLTITACLLAVRWTAQVFLARLREW